MTVFWLRQLLQAVLFALHAAFGLIANRCAFAGFEFQRSKINGRVAALACAAALAACGGGGGAGADPDPAGPEQAQPPRITAQPNDVSVVEGSAARFEVKAVRADSYQWELSSGDDWKPIAGAEGSAYTWENTTLTDDGLRFRVVVIGGDRKQVASSAVTLSVTAQPVPPSILVDLSHQSVVDGGDAVFSVTAGGTALHFAWEVSSGGDVWSAVADAAGPSLRLSNVSMADNGKLYRVTLSNEAGTLTSFNGMLTVLPKPPALQFIEEPGSVGVVEGDTASFNVKVTGTQAPRLQWQTSADGNRWTDIAGATSDSYTTPPVTIAQQGRSYRVVAVNDAATIVSSAATIYVSERPVAPAITRQPANVSIAAGDAARFVIEMQGVPTPMPQWQVSTNGVSWSNMTGESSLSYILSPAPLSASGNRYRVVLTSSAGTVTSDAALLTVMPSQPVIVEPPYSTAAVAGQPVTFNVTATGQPSPMFQWQRSTDAVNWSNIAGATGASYSIASPEVVRDSGLRLRVVATNAAGSATSSSAMLTVNPAPAPLICSDSSSAGWCWTHPKPQGRALVAIGNVGVGAYVAVTDNGSMLRTDDRGQSWTAVDAPRNWNAAAIAFSGSNVSVAVGADGAMFRSTDGGRSWSAIASGTTAALRDVAFVGPSVVMAVGNGGTMIRSFDAGQTWAALGSGTSNDLLAVAAADDNTVIITGANGTLIRSADQGDTWNAASVSGLPFSFSGNLFDVAFSSATAGLVVGEYAILRTSDGGQTWATSNQGITPQNLHTVAFQSSLHAYAFGSGVVLHSSDGGVSWGAFIDAGIQNSGLAAMAFETGGQGLGVGAGGLIVNMGTFTQPVGGNALRSSLRAVAFADANTVVALGGLTVYGSQVGMRSTDGGRSWTQILPDSAVMNHFHDLAFKGATGIAVGSNSQGGVIYRTTDAGATWSSARSVPGASINGVASSGGNVFIAVGEDASHHAVIYRSADSGLTWSLVQLHSSLAWLSDVAFASASAVVAVGDSGLVMRSGDAGLTWSVQASGTTEQLRAVSFHSTGVGVAVGSFGALLRSGDAGSTWVPISSGSAATLSGVVMASPTDAYAVGASGTSLKSVDGGLTWAPAGADTADSLYGVAAWGASNVLLVGDGGTVLRSAAAGR